MVKSYCVKQKKQTECVEPSGYKTAKNGRLMFWCTCAECGIKKLKFVKKKGKLSVCPWGRRNGHSGWYSTGHVCTSPASLDG